MDFYLDQRQMWIRSEQLKQEIIGQWRAFFTKENIPTMLVAGWIIVASIFIWWLFR